MKFKLRTDLKKTVLGIDLFQIEALVDFEYAKKGDLGGYVEKESNLDHSGNAWVYGNAWVSGAARVSGAAWVYGDAQVYENAQVSVAARVYGNTQVYGDAWVFGDEKEIKEDFYKVLDIAKHETKSLYDSLCSGKIDGSKYEGECACLVGTIAKARHENYKKLGINLRPNSNRPSEQFFMMIRKGDMPENNPASAKVKEWMEEWFKINEVSKG